MDQEADAGDDQHHHRRERIEQERDVGPEKSPTRIQVQSVCDDGALLGGQARRARDARASATTNASAHRSARRARPRGAALAEPVAEQQVQRTRRRAAAPG